MKHILAVCDSESGYAYGLADYLSTKKGFPFEVQVFTSSGRMKEFTQTHPLSVALVAEKDYCEDMKELPIEQMILLGEEKRRRGDAIPVIWKYQSCEKMAKELLDRVAGEGIIGRPVGAKNQMKLIGVYSPVGRCLKTSFSFLMGQLLGKKHRVLYLNMESYSGLGRLLKREFSTDMAELIYYLQNTPDNFGYRLGSMIEQIGGVDVMPPFHSFLDFISVTGEEWIKMFKEIERGSDYEYVILDLSDGIQNLFDVLRLCDLVYTLGQEDGFAAAKIEQYKEVLKKSNYSDIWDKTKHYTIPYFKDLPGGLLQLTYTELADYVKKKIEEDLHEGQAE